MSKTYIMISVLSLVWKVLRAHSVMRNHPLHLLEIPTPSYCLNVDWSYCRTVGGVVHISSPRTLFYQCTTMEMTIVMCTLCRTTISLRWITLPFGSRLLVMRASSKAGGDSGIMKTYSFLEVGMRDESASLVISLLKKSATCACHSF